MLEHLENVAQTAAIAVVCAAAVYAWAGRGWERRFVALEKETRATAEALAQLADIQDKSYRKLSGLISGIESRMLELSLSETHDTPIPLERRHKVLALARNGIPVDQIVERLGAPRGEVELILNLRKYLDTRSVSPR